MSTVQYTPREAMTIYAARTLKPYNNQNALLGIGIPTLAGKIAKNLWCENMHIIIENGSFDANLVEMPFSLFGGRTTYGAASQHDTCIALSSCIRGAAKIGFIGGAQVDKYGNVNTNWVGKDFKNMKRIAGSGGAVDIGGFCENTNIVLALSKRVVVDQVDFVTTPGWVCVDNTEGKREWVRREKLGLTGGPRQIITDMCIFKFGEDGIAYLDQIYPGISVQTVQENTGFDVDVSRAREADPITEEELNALRTQVDPTNVYHTR